VAIVAGSRSALVIARVGTGAARGRVLARVEWGRTRRYERHTAWRVVRRAVDLRRVRFRIGLPHGRAHVRVVVRRGILRLASGDHVVRRRARLAAAR
jgi:hypothetical protein